LSQAGELMEVTRSFLLQYESANGTRSQKNDEYKDLMKGKIMLAVASLFSCKIMSIISSLYFLFFC
jgi:hypothetical protein